MAYVAHITFPLHGTPLEFKKQSGISTADVGSQHPENLTRPASANWWWAPH